MIVQPFGPSHTPPTAGTGGLVTALRPRQLVAGLGALSLAAVLAFAGPAGAAELDPAGNNGTVKIDGIAFDDHPDNEPHPGCIFEVDFYGFDEGALLNATVTFTAIAPTGNDEILEVDDGIVFIGEDANDGGGSEAGLDASQEYHLYQELTDGDYEESVQGYHVKLTVHADGSIGADTKYKVFWVEDCVPPVVSDDDDVYGDDDDVVVTGDDDVYGDNDDVVVTGDDDVYGDDDDVVVTDDDTDESGDTGDTGDTEVSVVVPEVAVDNANNPVVGDVPAVEVMGLLVVAGPAVPGAAVSGAAVPTSAGSEVLGETMSRPDAAAAPAALARTGSPIVPSLIMAAACLMLGTLARRFGRAQTATSR